eukprot:1153851-Pelagomonas_calceolata.AAC.2
MRHMIMYMDMVGHELVGNPRGCGRYQGGSAFVKIGLPCMEGGADLNLLVALVWSGKAFGVYLGQTCLLQGIAGVDVCFPFLLFLFLFGAMQLKAICGVQTPQEACSVLRMTLFWEAATCQGVGGNANSNRQHIFSIVRTPWFVSGNGTYQ